MNSNRNRYASAPTYGMQKRTPVRKAAPKLNKSNHPNPQPMQGQAYPQMPYNGYPGGQAPVPSSSIPPQIPPQPTNAYPPYGMPYGYPQEQVVSYPTPSAGGNQTMGMPGYNPMNPPIPPQSMPNGTYQQPYPPMAHPPQQPQAPAKPRNKDAWLQILLLAVLPVLFVIAMILKQPPVYWVFIGFALVGLIAMWLQSSFVSSARTTLCLIYGALLVVSVVSLISGTPAADRTTHKGQQAAQTSVNQTASVNQQQDPAAVLASLENINNNDIPQDTLADVTTPEPPASSSEAALVLSNFMNLWNANKLDDMVSLCAPSWSSGEDSAVKSLYMLLANRRPVDYTIEKITGTDADSSRTITMTSTIDRQNNKEPVKYRFQVLMLKESNAWYVDPQSLASNDKAEEEKAAEGATPSPTPTAAPSSNTKLYYNPDGGSYYHAVNNCYRVNDKYLPLEPFYYKDLENTKFKNLKPCPYCKAPDRP